jgi:hypothetical protein
MVKKIIFYGLLILLLIFFQIYATPLFFVYAVFILFWLGLGAKEVYIFLIAAFFLDLLSSFYFGFWFLLVFLVFFSSGLILKQYLREWTTLTFAIVFTAWQIIYVFLYLFLAKQAWGWNIFFDLILSGVLGLIIFAVLNRLNNWLEKEGLISVDKVAEINI